MTDLRTIDPPDAAARPAPDADAWLRGLIRDHAAVLQRIAAGRVGPDDAEDAVSETYAIAWRERHRFDPALGSERAWLAGILINRCRVGRRARRRWEHRQANLMATAAPEAPDFSGAADARTDAARRHAAVVDAVRSLGDTPRLVLVLVAYAGLEPAEVAAALDLPAGTVRTHLHRARRAVTDLIAEEPTP